MDLTTLHPTDLGHYNLGFNNPNMTTPTIDKLAKEGLILERHYTCALTQLLP